ncbi:MAG: hypothetical protein MJY56_04060 [Bacteroidales bacterium]|nr:hypothetical protein [Bacteroidales bacterium]
MKLFNKRYYISVALSLLALAGCVEKPEKPDGELRNVEISASFSEISLTKAELSGMDMEWSAGDEIFVTVGTREYPFTTKEGGALAVFNGKLPGDAGRISAYYPADFAVPVVQSAVTGGVDPAAVVAEASGYVDKELVFEYACSFIRINVEFDNVRSIRVEAEKTELADGSPVVKLTSDNGKPMPKGAYYIATCPFAAKSLKITLEGDNDSKRSKTFENVVLESGECYVIKNTADWNESSSYDGPEQYIFVQSADWEYNVKNIYNIFGTSRDKVVGIGECAMFYIFERPIATLCSELRNHLTQAENYEIPILVELDPITFWDSVPELWNWFDPSISGFNPDNKENVEWYDWGSEHAVKIGWLNWGTQLRMKPMANLFSPKYQEAALDRMDKLMSIVAEWYAKLPGDKKYLLVGIKIMGELLYGGNNWYYPNGNDYYGKDESGDPTYGLNSSKACDPSWGVQQIGYAALTYSGIKTSGTVTADDICAMERKWVEWLADFCDDYGFPRSMLFAHAGGWWDHLASCINPRVCPSWSCYGADAKNPFNNSIIKSLVESSDAPYWGISEWASPVGYNVSSLTSCFRNSLGHEGCRYLSIFENVTGSYNGGDNGVNQNMVTAMKTYQSERQNK